MTSCHKLNLNSFKTVSLAQEKLSVQIIWINKTLLLKAFGTSVNETLLKTARMEHFSIYFHSRRLFRTSSQKTQRTFGS